jgi:hypothetical protein
MVNEQVSSKLSIQVGEEGGPSREDGNPFA